MNKKSVLILLCLAALSGLVGCGSNSSGGGTPPPPAAISIAFQPAPPSAITIIETPTFAATVTNDSLGMGVDWTINCNLNTAPSNSSHCGQFSIGGNLSGFGEVHTASGASITYVPPASFPTNTETVYISAFSTADNQQSVFATITVSGFAGNLQGTYVFSVTGNETASSSDFALAGVLVADGNGNIVTPGNPQFGGELTYSSVAGTFSDNILSQGSSYSINPDGTGTITLNTGDQNLPGDNGTNGVEIFSVVLLSAPQGPHGLINQTGPHASLGTLELQTSTLAAPSGGYAFAVQGSTVAFDAVATFTRDPLIFGGVFNIDSPGVISGNGSVVDEETGIFNPNFTTTGVLVPQAQLVQGSVVGPDSMGKVTIQFTMQSVSNPPLTAPIQLTGYIVDLAHIRLVESDYNQGTGAGFGITGGVAIGQGSATGSFLNASAFSGTFVYGILGEFVGSTSPGFSSLAGLFTAVPDNAQSTTGTLTNGVTDQTAISLVTGTFAAINDTSTGGTYSLDSSGTGRVTATMQFGNSSNGAAPTLIFYLTGNGNTPLVLNTDQVNLISLGAGVAYPQKAATFSMNGPYGVGNQVTNSAGFTGSFTACTVPGSFTACTTPGTIAGGISGSFVSGSSPSSRFTGSLSGGISESGVAFYPIDANRGLLTETDGVQAALGYFAMRTPLCATCLGSVSALRHSTATRTSRPSLAVHPNRKR